jgi:hypothetical protein
MITIKRNSLISMPLPPSCIIKRGEYFYYCYDILSEPKKPWEIEELNFTKQSDDEIIFKSNNIYDENKLWKKIKELTKIDELFAGTPDPLATEFIMSTFVANLIEDGKVWFMLIGKPSSGKTYTVNLFQSLEDLKYAYYVGKFTAAGFFSVANYDQSIITQVARGGTIVCRDFASFLGRGMINYFKIMNMLREIYDGVYEDKNAMGVYRWKGKIGLIICATPQIYRAQYHAQTFGDRFIYYRINPVFQPILSKKNLGEYIIENILPIIKNVSVKRFASYRYQDYMIALSKLYEALRTPSSSKYRKYREYTIEPSYEYRIQEQFQSLAAALSLIRGANSILKSSLTKIFHIVLSSGFEKYCCIIKPLFLEQINNYRYIRKSYPFDRKILLACLEDLNNFGVIELERDEILIGKEYEILLNLKEDL